MSENMAGISYKRNRARYLTTRTMTVNPANNLPVLGAGTLAPTDGAGVLAGQTDYSLYASAVEGGGAVILNPTAVPWEVPGGWTYLLPASLFDGTHGNLTAYLRVYQYGYSDPAHQVDEWAFVFTDSGR